MFRLTVVLDPLQCLLATDLAGWQSGYAADCNSVNAGSIPTPASIVQLPAPQPEWRNW